MGFRRRNSGSTATELGLIGSVVLVATLGMWFLLGDGLKQAFGLVKSDMLAQVSNAKTNALPVVPSGPPYEQPPPTLGDPVLEPVDPAPTVVTAGSNGTEAQAEIYKALQALIDRSIQKGTMTEAQADLLKAFVKHHTRFMFIQDVISESEIQAQGDFSVISKMEVQFEGQTYLLTDLAAIMGLEWDMEFSIFFDNYDENSVIGVYDSLYDQLDQNGLLDDPDVHDFLMDFYHSFDDLLKN
jgi:Flp pilus assembly pilin Flp